MHKGQLYCRNFGQPTPEAEELALIHLSEKRKEILMSRFGMSMPLARKKFVEVSALYLKRWAEEEDANGVRIHEASGVSRVETAIRKSIDPFFGSTYYDAIKPKDVMAWRVQRVREVVGTTVNREQVILSSVFSHVMEWMKLEQIKPFQVPAENPCQHVAKAPPRKRARLVTDYEISKLKNAARELGDENARENIGLALKTCLSLQDLKTLRFGEVVNLNRSKTGVAVNLPITVLHTPDWGNWRKRWEAVRARAGLADVEFRDLRKAGLNLIVGEFDIKLVSQYAGHADQKTTEAWYAKIQSDKMQAVAKRLSEKVDAL